MGRATSKGPMWPKGKPGRRIGRVGGQLVWGENYRWAGPLHTTDSAMS